MAGLLHESIVASVEIRRLHEGQDAVDGPVEDNGFGPETISEMKSSAKKINLAFPEQPLHINDHLSPENKLFLSKLKNKCREVGRYTYAWCRDGKLLAREKPGNGFL
ncbi:hypothetical protein J6590_028995 [Homalodisca vitripennis]|nr:hypothetical protein J6590_028995 [Homalodisca vitripennis]